MPVTDSNTDHPCGATGIGGVLVTIDGSSSERIGKAILVVTGNDEMMLSTPLGSNKPTIRLRQGDQPVRTHHLGLVLQALGTRPPADIHEEVGDGRISIQFESAEEQ